MQISSVDKKNTKELLKRAEKMYALAESYGEKRKGAIILNAFEQLHDHNNPAYIYALQKLRRMPVTIEEFLASGDFLGNDTSRPVIEIWPTLEKSICEINQDILLGHKNPNEVLMLGASGTGKSVRSIVTNLYQLYVADCFDWPQDMFQLSRPTELVFLFLSIKPSTAEKVLYKPFRQYFESMPFAQKFIEYDKDITSELRLNNNKTVRFASANVNSLIGHAVMSGAIDEINFFARVEKSKQTPDGGTFDQADLVHKTLLNRRESRFTSAGPNPGTICISAQTKYKGDFTDRRIQQIQKNKEKNVLWYREKRYEVVPKERLSYDADGKLLTFKVLVGTDEYPTRIMDEHSKYTLPPHAEVLEIPMTYHETFKRDPEHGLREIVGIATNAITPFIPQRHKIHEAAAAWTTRDHKPWTTQSNYILNEYNSLNENNMPVLIPENLPRDGKPRYIHVDLAVSSDRCGIAICHIDGYVDIAGERLPYYVTDWVVTLEPDSLNQVDIAEVRRWVVDLKLKHGLDIARVSYDGYQCVSDQTDVWTDRGIIKAGDIQVGDIVQTRIGPKPVVEKWEYGVQPCLTITTYDNRSLTMTKDHKIEVAKDWTWIKTAKGGNTKVPVWGWKKASDIQLNDVVRVWDQESDVDSTYQMLAPFVSNNLGPNGAGKQIKVPAYLDDAFGYFLGLVHGDGNITQDGVHITCHVSEKEDVMNVFRATLGVEPSVKSHGENCVTVSVYNRAFVTWLKDHLLHKTGEVPTLIKQSPKNVQRTFIRGLLDTDGSVGKRDGKITYGSTNKNYIEYIQHYLSMAEGIECNYSEKWRTHTNLSNKAGFYYTLNIRGSREKFIHIIGLSYTHKNNELTKHSGIEGRKIWSKVKSITESEDYVVDFEVEDDHAYLANGFVSHNSTESVQMIRKLGINSINISVDKTLEPYEVLREAIYTNRLAMPNNDLLKSELSGLELNLNANQGKGKVDHTPIVGKDAADAMCGAIFNASISGVAKVNSGHVGQTTQRPRTGERPRSRTGATI